MVMKTPGVYIVEKNAFPNSVVQVATAVPAFVGHTQKAEAGNVSIAGKPQRLTSMTEFESYFGGPPTPVFALREFQERGAPFPYGDGSDMAADPELPQAVFTAAGPNGREKYELVQTNPSYLLWAAMRVFYANGGGACWVVSCGSYQDEFDPDTMTAAIKKLEKEGEPTMLVVPETTRLTRQNSKTVQEAMLAHCGDKMKNRFAILDIHGGYLDESERGDPVASFRNDVGSRHLDFAAAYYPWLNGSIFGARDFTFENIGIDTRKKLVSLLKRSVNSDPKLIDDIKKVGTAELSGDFTISVPKGGETILTPGDLMARDDSTDAAQLQYEIVGGGAEMPGAFKRDGSEDEVRGFTQEEIAKGKITFVHDPAKGERGSFSVVVIDEEGVKTATRKVDVIAGNAVLPVAAVEQGTTAKIEADEDGADEGSVRLIGADPIDEVEVVKEDEDVQTARDAVAEAGDDATDEQREALKAAEAAAIAKARDKKLTSPGIGRWTVEGNEITFAPEPGLRAAEASVEYALTFEDGARVERRAVRVLLDGIEVEPPADPMLETVDKTLRVQVPLYNDVMKAAARHANAIPPGAAMAGIYTMVDNSRGVWKAPANISVNGVTSPMVDIGHDQQENLNVHTTGKSINAIRPFVGEGTLVWGARTLDGNSLDWRYVNVRRTMIMIEELIRLASKAYVFEPNTANTWVTIRSMLENFLTSVWKAGGLAGSSPAEAFSVHVGLGDTMTPVDILEGRMLISVFVAVTRPAEFIQITFTQKMQES